MANYTADYKQGAVNPYNFVRLGNGVTRTAPFVGNNTGVIHCSLTTYTPLAIPDFSCVEMVMDDKGNKEHKTTSFIKINCKPIIPGSEIRGVIRSAYETLSNSCLSVNNNNILSARSADVRNPGVIRFENKDKKWHLYEAESKKLKYDGSEDFDETADTFKRSWRNYKYIKTPDKRNPSRIVSSAYRKGGKIQVDYKFTTSFQEIFAEDIDGSVRDYSEVCNIYKKGDKNISKYIPKLTADGKCFPVYYTEYFSNGKKYVYLSPAQISRSVFRNKVNDLLGTYCRCVSTAEVCDACNLFGMIGAGINQPSAIASRVRFTDAQIVGEPNYVTAILKELAGPKISSVEFYSTAPNMKELWTYDSDGVKLNGRKYYFHHTGDYCTSNRTCRNITTELVDKGAQFTFDVFFNNITDEELHKLVWTLTIGENSPDGKQMHKIGHGKPIGLGSVKITVSSVEKRNFDAETFTYTQENVDISKYTENIPFDSESEYFSDYMKITDFTFLGDRKVAYPYGDDGKDNETSKGTLVWFKANHNDGQMIKPDCTCSIGYHLPKITDEKKIIPALISSDENQSDTSGGKKNESYKGPTKFESSRKIVPTANVRCPKCKTMNKVETASNVFCKKPRTVICCKCKKQFTTSPM